MTTDTDASMLPEDWAEALREHEYDVDRLATLVACIYDGASPGTVIIKSAHPTARGWTKQKPFKDCHPFSAANSFLIAHDDQPVNWNLVATTSERD